MKYSVYGSSYIAMNSSTCCLEVAETERIAGNDGTGSSSAILASVVGENLTGAAPEGTVDLSLSSKGVRNSQPVKSSNQRKT